MPSHQVKPNAIFGQIFDELEKEVMKLSYQISLDEDQKEVYSINIAEMQLRIYTQIEAALKDIYVQMNPQQQQKTPKYDEIIESLDWLNDIVIYVPWQSYNLKKKIYRDSFKKSVKRVTKVVAGQAQFVEKKNYKFNNAYQNLRHDFVNALPIFGTIEYLFEALVVLCGILGKTSTLIFSGLVRTEEKNAYWAWVTAEGSRIRKKIRTDNWGQILSE